MTFFWGASVNKAVVWQNLAGRELLCYGFTFRQTFIGFMVSYKVAVPTEAE